MRRVVICLGYLTAFVGSMATAAELSQSLDSLLNVEREGVGNPAASAAWREIVAAPVDDLPTILAALDDAQPLSANWIRAAVDTICERELAAGRKLPSSQLERFALDTQHSPRARRLAFEWLVRADATATDRLVPNFLDDPSVELRRDAVERLIAEAERLLDGKEGEQPADQPGVVTLKKAFEAARDLDQVDQLAGRLEGLGHPVDIAKHFGFVLNWKVIGPFDNTGEKAFDVEYPPEKSLDPKAEHLGKDGSAVRWLDHVSTDAHGNIDLNAPLGKAKSVVGYAVNDFYIDAPREVELRLTSPNAQKVWVNDEVVLSNNRYHTGTRHDQYVGKIKLNAGRNVILVKLLQDNSDKPWAGDWQFALRVCDPVGTAVLSQSAGATAP